MKKEKQYIYINYDQKFTLVGTAREIAHDLEVYEDPVPIDDNDYIIREYDNYDKTGFLTFWDVFEQKIIPRDE